MIRRVTFLALTLTALFALQFADCFSPVSADEQAMQCCGSMPCGPSDQSHDCCKTMLSADASNALPAQHVDLGVPVIAGVDRVSKFEAPIFTQVFRLSLEAPQHAPPELYTLHSSLLI